MAVGNVRVGADASQTTGGSAILVPFPDISAGVNNTCFVCVLGENVIGTTPTPSGWTKVVDYNPSNGPQIAMFLKAATGSETGSQSFSVSGGTSQGKMIAFDGVDLATLFSDADAAGSSTAVASFPIPAMDVLVDGSAVVTAIVWNSITGSTTYPTGYTQLAQQVAINPGLAVAYLIGHAVGTETITWGRPTAIRGSAAGVVLPAYAAVPLEGGLNSNAMEAMSRAMSGGMI